MFYSGNHYESILLPEKRNYSKRGADADVIYRRELIVLLGFFCIFLQAISTILDLYTVTKNMMRCGMTCESSLGQLGAS